MVTFHGQRVLVTGGGSGIGRACALAFASAGAQVFVADRDQSAARETVGLGGGTINEAACLAFNVGEEGEVQEAIARVFDVAPVDVLVNGAGLCAMRPFLETDVSLLDSMFAENLRGTFLCSQAVARRMVETGRGGAIVNVVSASGLRVDASCAGYSATMAAVASLTQAMAIELARFGIWVNAVAPRPTDMQLVAATHSETAHGRCPNELQALRYVAADDVARGVLFLANPRSACVSGQVFAVNEALQELAP
jgi:NAD(P)-dependent dehydrogenase (short-subunit alcohol dehydrogenase family)